MVESMATRGLVTAVAKPVVALHEGKPSSMLVMPLVTGVTKVDQHVARPIMAMTA